MLLGTVPFPMTFRNKKINNLQSKINSMETFDLKYWIFVVSVLGFSLILSFTIKRILSLVIRKRLNLLNADPTNFNFLKNSVVYIILTIAIIVIINKTPALENFGKALFAGAGIIAATIGFASQKAFSNVISGIFILVFKPFRVYDTIELNNGEVRGVVEEITLRHTIIKNYENRRVIIPNSRIGEETITNSNLLDTRIKKHINIGIGYSADIDKAKAIMFDVITSHPLFLDARTEEEIEANQPVLTLRVIDLGEYAVTIRAWAWARTNDDAFVLYCDSIEDIKKRFDREGIEIPFPYRSIVVKNEQDQPKA